ncbi:peptidoglycan-binding protein [Bradyrhizobium sp. S3.7.6]
MLGVRTRPRPARNSNSGAQDKNVQGKNAQDPSTTTTGANTNGNAQDQSAQGATTGVNTQGQTNAQAQGQTNAQAQTQGEATQSMSGRVQVNAHQQTRLQQSVLNSRDVERVRVNENSINFRVNAGVVVPRNISVVSVSDYPALIDVYPDYRDDSFFVVGDEIVVTDRSRRIVDVIPAGPRAHYVQRGSSSGGGSSVAALDLGPDEIRIVQRVLIQRGLLSGEADGVLGPDTRTALITFQRQEGFQTTGSIDTRTVAALGVSDQISAKQSTTVGQGQNGQSSQQNTTGQSNAPAQQNQTTGQALQNQPSTSGEPQHNQSTYSGQAGTQQPPTQTTGRAPAQSNNPSTGQPSTNQNTRTGQTNQNNAPASPAHK